MLQVSHHIFIPLKEFDFSFARSSGPGGQNVNKVNSKAILKWNPALSKSLPEDVRSRFLERFSKRITEDGTLTLQSDRFRDQGRNVADCLEKLKALLLEVAAAPKKRKKTKPTKASRERRLEGKRKHSDKKKSRQLRWD